MNQKRSFSDYVHNSNEQFNFLNYTLGHSTGNMLEYLPFTLDKPDLFFRFHAPVALYSNHSCDIKTFATDDPNVNECVVSLFYQKNIHSKNKIDFEDKFSFLSNDPIDLNELINNFFALVYHFEQRKPIMSNKYIQTGDQILNNIEHIKNHQPSVDLAYILGSKYDKYMNKLAGRQTFWEGLTEPGGMFDYE